MWWFPILGIEGGLQTIFQRWDGPLGPRSDGILRNSTHELHEPCGIIGNGGVDLGFPMVFPWFSHGFPMVFQFPHKKKKFFQGQGANSPEQTALRGRNSPSDTSRVPVPEKIYVARSRTENWNYPMPHASTIRRRSQQSQAIGSTALLWKDDARGTENHQK
jgi:hypothetical protein